MTQVNAIGTFYSPTDLDEIIKAQGSIFANPINIRSRLLTSYATDEAKKIISRICTLIVILGPNPDRAYVRIRQRLAVSGSKDTKALDYVLELNKLLRDAQNKVAGLRGTQVQAALPDLIYQSRKFLMDKGLWTPQAFIKSDLLPVEYQFPGAAPIIPQEHLDAYPEFAEAFSMAISQNKRHANEQIVKQSMAWRIVGETKVAVGTGVSVKKEMLEKAENLPKLGVKSVGSRIVVTAPNSMQFGARAVNVANALKQTVMADKNGKIIKVKEDESAEGIFSGEFGEKEEEAEE